MNLLHRMPIMWKVLSAPLIAMICMALYLGSTVWVFKQNNSRLASVRDVQFPVLEVSTENVAALDKIIDNLNGGAASGEPEQLQAADKIAAKVRANYARLRTIDTDSGAELQRLSTEFDAYYSTAREIAAMMVNQSGAPDAQRLALMSTQLATYRKDLTAFRDLANRRFSGTIDASTRDADQAVLAGVVIGAIGLAVTLAFGILVARALLRQLNRAVKVAQTVAAGDLTSHIEITSNDETGQLLLALREMNDSLVRIVGQVRGGADAIANTSGQIAAGNQDLSSRTEQQASSLEETATSMGQLTSAVRQNADNALQVNGLAVSASEVARKGGAVVSQVVGTMGSINESAKKIADIIGVIDGIAFQTNILALNAAVEAARAGEQGRGFAVVATEVRNLAQRSAAAAKEIKALISDSVEKVDAGGKLVDQAGATMDEIVISIKRVTDIMGEITTASQEQSAGIEQVNQALTQMDQVTQQNSALVEEATAAAESLQDEAAGLVQLVSVFKLNVHAAVAPSRQSRNLIALNPAAPVGKIPSSVTQGPNAKEWKQF